MNIYQRINSVMQDVKYIKKDQQVSGGGASYKAVTHDQVLSKVRESMIENGIVVEPHQRKGKWSVMRDMNAQPQPIKMGLYEGKYTIYFVNIEDPKDRAKIKVDAHANDNGDKAPGKAMTYATKTAILKMFSLETGLNDESREGQEVISEDIEDKYKYLVDTSDHIGLFEFMAQWGPDDPIRKSIVGCWDHGEKTKMKNIHLDLISKAHKDFAAWADELNCNKDDNQVCEDYWDDLSEILKRSVWKQLTTETKEFLRQRNKGGQ